jgi:hypothetical protein
MARVNSKISFFLAIAATALLTGCGGSSSSSSTPPPPPAGDFSISVSATSVSAVGGMTSAPVTVSITGSNGFSGTVSVALTGLPTGVVGSPSSPLSIAAGASAQVTFTVPANASTGSSSLTLQGTSGTLSHNASLTLNVGAPLTGAWVVLQPTNSVSNDLLVSGWAFEGNVIASVTILVDNASVGNAFYGVDRPDVAASVHGAPTNCGWSLGVDTTKLSNGAHTISVSVTDSANNVGGIPQPIQVTVNNAAPVATGPVANIALNAPTTSLVEGTIVAFSASATNSSGQAVAPAFTWSSSNPAVVQVTPTGAILPLAAGNATISVSAGGQTQQTAVTVAAGSGAPGTIQVSVGPEETVFQYTLNPCMEGDYPDAPARAVRLSDGSLALSAAHDQFWFMSFGADFYSLKRNCTPAWVSIDNWTASTFTNRQWIFSLYNDGSTIHALVHNEYHDPVAQFCLPGYSGDQNPCEYNSISYASSTDGGHTFTMLPSPQAVIAPPPIQWVPPSMAGEAEFDNLYYGYFEPTNIVHNTADGYYYARVIAFTPPPATPAGGNCVMRTQTLSDPTSWRAWDGSSFSLQMTNPYTGPSAANCVQNPTVQPYESLTFNTYLNKFMVAGGSNEWSGSNPTQCGIYLSLSSDLVNWSAEQLIEPAYIPAPTGCQKPGSNGLAGSIAYGSIIDHADPSLSFETPGRTPYLYYTRFNDNAENRDLVRVPLLITQH